MSKDYPDGMSVTSSRTPATPEPTPAEPTETQPSNVVVPYKPSTDQPEDLNQLVDHLQRENAELKALVTDRDAFTEAVRDAVHNAPAKPPIDPRNCTTEEYLANREEIAKQLGIRRYSS